MVSFIFLERTELGPQMRRLLSISKKGLFFQFFYVKCQMDALLLTLHMYLHFVVKVLHWIAFLVFSTLLLLVLNKIKTTRLSIKVVNKCTGCKNPASCGQRRRPRVIYSSSSSEQGQDRPSTSRGRLRSTIRGSSCDSRRSEESMPPSYNQAMQ